MEWEQVGSRTGKEGLFRSWEANIYRRSQWGLRETDDVFSSHGAVRKMRLAWRDDPSTRILHPLGTSVLGSV